MKLLTPRRTKIMVVQSSTYARRLLWHPFELDTTYLSRPDAHEPYEKPGVHLFWVLAGRGVFETQGETYDLMPGNCFWFADMSYRRVYRPRAGEVLVKQGIRFGGIGVELWHKELSGSKKARFFLKDPETIRKDFQIMWQICRRQPRGWEWQIHLMLTKILGQLLDSRSLLSFNDPEIPTPVVRVLDLLATNPFNDWKVKEMAACAGVSYSKLRDLFFQTQGVSLHQFIQQRRLDQARLLLADEKLSIKEVAEQLHFSTVFYFSHFFKRLSGVSPTNFRVSRRNKK